MLLFVLPWWVLCILRFIVDQKAFFVLEWLFPWYLTLDVWRRWLDRDMSRANEKLLPETCLCVYITPAISSECISASRSDKRWHSFVYWLQGHALHVSLYHCHQGSKHWRRAANSHNSGAVYACKDGADCSPGEGIAGFMKHDSCLEWQGKRRGALLTRVLKNLTRNHQVLFCFQRTFLHRHYMLDIWLFLLQFLFICPCTVFLKYH